MFLSATAFVGNTEKRVPVTGVSTQKRHAAHHQYSQESVYIIIITDRDGWWPSSLRDDAEEGVRAVSARYYGDRRTVEWARERVGRVGRVERAALVYSASVVGDRAPASDPRSIKRVHPRRGETKNPPLPCSGSTVFHAPPRTARFSSIKPGKRALPARERGRKKWGKTLSTDDNDTKKEPREPGWNFVRVDAPTIRATGRTQMTIDRLIFGRLDEKATVGGNARRAPEQSSADRRTPGAALSAR